MRRWELAFPIAGILLALWATLPDLPHGCAFDWQAMCGWDAIFRFDIILPIIGSLAVWALVRTFLPQNRQPI